MKRLILSMLTLFATSAMWADSALFVHPKTGGVLEIAFSEKPVVTYSDGNLVISVTGASVSYPLSNMDKFTFGEMDDQVTRITAPVNAVPQPTYIYSIDGKLLRTFKPSEDGTTSASLDGLQAGTYVIKNGKISYKVLKK